MMETIQLMHWYDWVFFVATLPVAIMGAVAVVYALFLSWVLLLAVCGLKFAQDIWRRLG